MKADKHPQEEDRIAALRSLHILDTSQEEEFDELVEIASSICNTPISLISLVDADRQWFKARLGLEVSETSLQESVCAHAILTDETLIIDDTLLDRRTVDNPLVHNDVNMRFYAGVPLMAENGMPVGTLCVLDTVPRQLSADQQRALEVLGRQVMTRITLRTALQRERDLKQQMEAQRDELLRVNRQLVSNDESKNLFLAMLSHELRNPLSALNNGLVLLDEADSEMQRHDTVQMMQRQCAQLKRLLDDLLDVSRISRGKVSLKRRLVCLAPILDDAVRTLRGDAALKQISVHLHAVDENIRVFADAARLLQVVVNLLHNAIRYTPVGGCVTLQASASEDQVRIQIQDSGRGISEQDLDKVFDFFVQLETDTASSHGLGLGLALVKELVNLHGGSVAVQSEGPGLGSTFCVSMPLAVATQTEVAHEERGPAAPVKSATAAHARETAAPLDILVTDDNVDSITALGRLLERRRHRVRLAASGAEALQAVRERRPDVVLLDIGLPDMSGHEVARHLRAELPDDHLLLIATTGYGQPEDRQRSREAGFDHHLTKPVDLARLNEHLAAFRHERQASRG